MRAEPRNMVWHDQFKTALLANKVGAAAHRENGEGNLCSLRLLAIYRSSLLFKSGRGGDVDFKSLACRSDLSRHSVLETV